MDELPIEIANQNPTPSKVRVERWVAPLEVEADQPTDETRAVADESLRPQWFRDYPGQDKVKANLEVYVAAARRRDQPLDHVLLHGPPGLGKTTLAQIVAHEMGVSFHQSSGPVIERPGDLAGILAGLDKGAIFFIDEIHRLPLAVEEVLYTAMEDFSMDIVVGQGPAARSVKMPLMPFTLVGATTRVASLSSPLISRFGIQERLEFYDNEALAQILERSARIWNISLEEDGAAALARRSRGTPRIANRLLRRVRDFAEVSQDGRVDSNIVNDALLRLEIDAKGLDRMDRFILQVIAERYDGGPVGLDTLSATIGEEKSTIEEVYEPFLVHQGFISRGPRGRVLTSAGRLHLEAVLAGQML